jgi:hypothetical protein
MAAAFAFMPRGWRRRSFAGRGSGIIGFNSILLSFWLWLMAWTGRRFDPSQQSGRKRRAEGLRHSESDGGKSRQIEDEHALI